MADLRLPKAEDGVDLFWRLFTAQGGQMRCSKRPSSSVCVVLAGIDVQQLGVCILSEVLGQIVCVHVIAHYYRRRCTSTTDH